jgi:hypothetical protein
MLVRPRLTDYYDLPLTQEAADFAIPFLNEDIPLYADPFLLWRSPAQSERALHTLLISSFNGLGDLARLDRERAISTLVTLSECEEIGLGAGRTRTGRRIGRDTADEILRLLGDLPDVERQGIQHVEVLQLYIDQISKDRVSDFTCSILKSHLIDYTIACASAVGVPLVKSRLNVFNAAKLTFEAEDVDVPANPVDGKPLLLVPKRWLRHAPWISFDDFFARMVSANDALPKQRIPILNYNRTNHGIVSAYVAAKERQQSDCSNDPLFRPVPVTSAKKKLATIRKLQTGKDGNADKMYEDAAGALLASLLYPHLDFASEQSRTESGVLIRDLIFYNGRGVDFLKDIYDKYASRQLVFELKNVKEIEREHVNQLNRYLNDEFGKCGVLVTRNLVPAKIRKNIVDLWSGQRRAIIVLTDADLELMVSVFDTKQREPYEVLKRAYIDFTQKLPS